MNGMCFQGTTAAECVSPTTKCLASFHQYNTRKEEKREKNEYAQVRQGL